MAQAPIAVIGAGIGGLSAALALANAGREVVVIEAAATAGGKMRQLMPGGRATDSGPTVFTMRWVFDELLAGAGTSLEQEVRLQAPQILARHAWGPGQQLDLHASAQQSAAAIAEFSSAAEGERYLRFCEQAERTYRTLENTFLRAQKPNVLSLTGRTLAQNPAGLLAIQPFARLWRTLGSYFKDPRLQQLFGRYATYCGASPYLAPATLMLVAHVEQSGVWRLPGGMQDLATALQRVATARGVEFRFGERVVDATLQHGRIASLRTDAETDIPCSAVVCNADPGAVAAGMLGDTLRKACKAMPVARRSLSAVTFSMLAPTRGFALHHHNVFFSDDYAREFQQIIGRGQLPEKPTVYVCAQDRDLDEALEEGAAERLLCLVNAPANGDSHQYTQQEIAECTNRTLQQLTACGLQVDLTDAPGIATTPSDFARLFPGSGGALYGEASHGWQATFRRPAARTAIAGLYLAGGAVHPGPGVPMAALSGRLAAASLLQDSTSASRLRTTATSGGMSTP